MKPDSVLAVIVGIAIALFGMNFVVGVGLTSFTADYSVDSDPDWNSGTLTNLNASNGTISIVDGQTSGTYISPQQSYNENISSVSVDNHVPENASINATVTIYSSETAVDSVEQEITSHDSVVDASSLANQTADNYDIELELTRDATSDESPTVDGYEVLVEESGQYNSLFGLVLMILVLGIVATAVKFK